MDNSILDLVLQNQAQAGSGHLFPFELLITGSNNDIPWNGALKQISEMGFLPPIKVRVQFESSWAEVMSTDTKLGSTPLTYRFIIYSAN